MIKITVGIEGMACGMCEAHINDAASILGKKGDEFSHKKADDNNY